MFRQISDRLRNRSTPTEKVDDKQLNLKKMDSNRSVTFDLVGDTSRTASPSSDISASDKTTKKSVKKMEIADTNSDFSDVKPEKQKKSKKSKKTKKEVVIEEEKSGFDIFSFICTGW